MNLISKIYHRIVNNSEEYACESEAVNEIICEILDKYKDKLVLEEIESLEEILYSLVLVSEEQGFRLGLKFGLALLEEIHLEHEI